MAGQQKLRVVVKGDIASGAIPAPPRLTRCKIGIIGGGCAQGIGLILLYTRPAQAKATVRCQHGTALA